MKRETNPHVLGVFRTLPGLEQPWKLVAVELFEEPKRVDVELEWPASARADCPECGRACAIYDHGGTRWWRHLDTMGHLTRLCCRVPRCACPEHGVRTVRVPWAEGASRFTEQFECRAIELLLVASNQKQAAGFMRMSWGQTHRIQCQAVNRGLARREHEPILRVGLDEKSFGKAHHYATVLSDLDAHRVLEVVEHRTLPSARRALGSLGAGQLPRLEAVAMDRWEPYMSAARLEAPQADIVHDRFHVVKHLNEAVDTVRKREHAALSAQACDWLTGGKYLFLKAPEKWHAEEQCCFAELQGRDLQVTKAWGARENFQHFWAFATLEGARSFFAQWLAQAVAKQVPDDHAVGGAIEPGETAIMGEVRLERPDEERDGGRGNGERGEPVAAGFALGHRAEEQQRENVPAQVRGAEVREMRGEEPPEFAARNGVAVELEGVGERGRQRGGEQGERGEGEGDKGETAHGGKGQ
jgi:transposase